MSITVTTKEQLEQAMKNKENEIIVVGELAEKLHKSKKVTTLGTAALVTLGTAIAAMPFTGGISGAVGFASVATLTGLEIAVIAGVVFIGLGMLIALFKDYDEISVEMGENPKMTLRRKSKD